MTAKTPAVHRRVVLSTWGRFHFFHLARELEKRGMLEAIFTTYPMFKLRDEIGIPREKVHCDWLVETAMLAANRYGVKAHRSEVIDTFKVRKHDRWLSRRVPDCDLFIALSGSGPVVGPMVQKRGGRWICDRGSTHLAWQTKLLSDEYARWGFEYPPVHPVHVGRENTEYEQADRIVVPSRFAKQSFVEMGLDPAKILVVPYGANLSRFAPQCEPAKDEFVILFVGQFGLRKGAPYLLEAFARFRHPRKRLRIVGAILPQARAIMGRFDLEGVEFVGEIPNKLLAQHYSSANVLVLPSVEEGFGLVMGEAMACGCPVVATRNTGAPELFEHEREGLIVPAQDAEELATAFERIAQDPDLRQAMSAASLARVRGIGGWDEYGAGYAQVIGDTILGAPGRMARQEFAS